MSIIREIKQSNAIELSFQIIHVESNIARDMCVLVCWCNIKRFHD